jgi:hypothetical protein
MTSRTIEVIVSPKGESKIETRGFAGSLPRASRFLEQALARARSSPSSIRRLPATPAAGGAA